MFAFGIVCQFSDTHVTTLQQVTHVCSSLFSLPVLRDRWISTRK